MDTENNDVGHKRVKGGNELDVPLVLMSKFCDSALKELSNGVRKNERNGDSAHGNSVSASSSTFVPNAHSSSQVSSSMAQISVGYSNQSKDAFNIANHQTLQSGAFNDAGIYDILNCSDLMEIESQQLQLQRKITLSKHIKSLGMSQFISNDCEIFSDTGEILQCDKQEPEWDELKTVKVGGGRIMVQERLEYYLPVLKNRIRNGKWCSLNEHSLINNVNAGTQEIFYGVLVKSTPMKIKRLECLYENIGVASLPLQSMSISRTQLHLYNGKEKFELNCLTNQQKLDKVLTGLAVAVVGGVNGKQLDVEDVVFATPCSPQWPLPRENSIEMVFVSGLNLGHYGEFSAALDLLQDYLLGLTGSAFEQKEIASQRSRLFLVGNSISNIQQPKCEAGNSFNGKGRDEIVEKEEHCTNHLDDFLQPILESMEVFICPGETDPAFYSSLPQPPLHPKLVPQSSQLPTLKRLTNPARVQVSFSDSQPCVNHDRPSQSSNCSLMDSSIAELMNENVSFIDILLQSGKNIKECMDNCDISCPFEMGIKLLQWGHLNPSYCDNNLAIAEDLFRLQGSLPNLVVIGNLSEFKVVNFNGAKIIGVPAFHKSHTVVVLTRDFDVIPLSFKLA